MKLCNTAIGISLLGSLISSGMIHSEEVLHHDLLPMYSPDNPAFLRDLAKRFDRTKNASKLKELNKTQELCIYIFHHDITIRIEVFVERENTKHAAPVAYWMEFSRCSTLPEKEFESYVAAFPINASFERHYSLAWRSLLFRTNVGYFDARIMTGSPWMMVTGWGLQGRLQEPYSESPVGRLLSETLKLVNSGRNGKIDPDTWESRKQNVTAIQQSVKPTDGSWKFEVADPYERARDDAGIPRFSFAEFLEIDREAPD